ncbi:MATE family efflux transporter [Helicobacter valdiviensis]|uniref:MATE family efflux transporter n=1 Tax=Helicobacter valdiviensis TaxID=1458358 RepID=A0A2W6MZ61_9HELI|nr:MATE family efflux transporter [Helicobacter valdiviensis]PZT48618.1 MATE family efflux transporter [Helicobacter valdiviensis]
MQIHDFYTTLHPTKLFLKCALPNMASAAFLCAYFIIDGIFVGRYLGSEALAAMNLMMPFIMISFALADMIAIGSSVQISMNLGRGRSQKAKNIFSFCVMIIFVISCIMGILGYFLALDLSQIMGADSSLQKLCVEYMQIFALFAPFIIISFALDNYLRICGKTLYSMAINISIALINIFLDWLFIVVFGWGLFSAALATCIGMLFGVIAAMAMLIFGGVVLKFNVPKITFYTFKNIIYNGSSEFFSNISSSLFTILANMLLLKIANNTAVAAFSIVLYVSSFVFSLILAMCDSLQPALSYNYGFKNFARIQEIFKQMLVGAFLLSLCVFLVIFFNAREIVLFFDKQNNLEFVNLATTALALYVFSFLFSWFPRLCASFFTALDKPKLSLVISILQSLAVPFVILEILSYFYGLKGVWLSSVVSEVCMVLIAYCLLKKNLGKL